MNAGKVDEKVMNGLQIHKPLRCLFQEKAGLQIRPSDPT